MDHHDPLTRLPNMTLFQDRLSQAIALAKRQGKGVAVVDMEFLGLEPLAAKHGHAAGEELIRLVAKRLRGLVRSSDTVARVGGEEFIILLNSVESTEAAEAVASEIKLLATKPYSVGNQKMSLQPVFGLGVYPDDGQTGSALMSLANESLHKTKNNGQVA